MNALVRKEMEYRAKIHALGSRVRALGLDLEDAVPTPERDEEAERLVRDNPPRLVEDALRFASHVREMADPGCLVCGGVGVVKHAECRCGGKVDDKVGWFVHAEKCEEGVAAETNEWVPCACAARREREAHRRAQEAAPAFRVKSTKSAEMDRRVAEAEAQLAAAEGRRDAAVAPIAEKIRERYAEVAAYEAGKTDILRALAGDDEEVGRHSRNIDVARAVEREGRDQDVARAREGREDAVSARLREVLRLREALAAAEADLEVAREERDREIRRDIAKYEEALAAARVRHIQHRARLANYEAEHEVLVREVGALRAERDRVARHHELKIEKARRRLNRLKYLRGDRSDVTPEEIKVAFAPGGVG